MRRSRLFSDSREEPLALFDWGGAGIFNGSPAFRCLIHSSKRDFNCISESFDLECNSLKVKVTKVLLLSMQRFKGSSRFHENQFLKL